MISEIVNASPEKGTGSVAQVSSDAAKSDTATVPVPVSGRVEKGTGSVAQVRSDAAKSDTATVPIPVSGLTTRRRGKGPLKRGLAPSPSAFGRREKRHGDGACPRFRTDHDAPSKKGTGTEPAGFFGDAGSSSARSQSPFQLPF